MRKLLFFASSSVTATTRTDTTTAATNRRHLHRHPPQQYHTTPRRCLVYIFVLTVGFSIIYALLASSSLVHQQAAEGGRPEAAGREYHDGNGHSHNHHASTDSSSSIAHHRTTTETRTGMMKSNDIISPRRVVLLENPDDNNHIQGTTTTSGSSSSASGTSMFAAKVGRSVEAMGAPCCKEFKLFYQMQHHWDPDCGRSMEDWLSRSYPTCNLVYELSTSASTSATSGGHDDDDSLDNDATTMTLLGVGSWRTAWKVILHHGGGKDHDSSVNQSSADVVILKRLRSDKDTSEPAALDKHRMDALVMDRMTSTHHSVKAYAYCGNTVITERGEKTLREYLDQLKKADKAREADTTGTESDNNKHLLLRHQVQVARDAATVLASLHDVEAAQIDIKTDNFLWMPDGRIALNDFNLAQPSVCGYKKAARGLNDFVAMLPERWDPSVTFIKLEKLDVFQFGATLWEILLLEEPTYSNQEDWGYRLTTTRQFLPAGTAAVLPSHPYAWALKYAALACQATQPEDRPVVSDLVKGFNVVLTKYDAVSPSSFTATDEKEVAILFESQDKNLFAI